jgi:hypothetical protein
LRSLPPEPGFGPNRAKPGLNQQLGRGSGLEKAPVMDVRPDPQLAPCPFCHGGSLALIGQSRTFLYYRCEGCAEVWTVTAFRPITDHRPKLSTRSRSSSERVLS